MTEPECYTSQTIQSVLSDETILRDYIEISQRLHGKDFCITAKELTRLLTDPKELVAFILLENKLVATAQASLLYTLPTLQVAVNNVVTHPDFGGRGLGKLVMSHLEHSVTQKWGDLQGSLRLSLTNSPQKGNGGFYEACGWTARTAENNNETVVWVKELSCD